MLIQRQNSLCRPARNYGVTRFSEILLSRMKFLENYEIIWKKTKKKLIKTYKIEKNGKINKKIKKCVDKLELSGYNKITKTNSHR